MGRSVPVARAQTCEIATEKSIIDRVKGLLEWIGKIIALGLWPEGGPW